MKTKITTLLIVLTLAACNHSQDNTDKTNKINSTPNQRDLGFIKSAHYFSSAWPKNFWQAFEEPDVVPELQQIKADGFNTIVLTVPWRGFETGFNNRKTTANKALYQRLEFLLETIIQQDLYYMLRVGFPHDYTPNTGTDGMQQCVGIYTDEKMQNHWQNYLENIKQTIKPYQHAQTGIIVSWEDFWCPHFVFPNMNDEKRLAMAQAMGYGDWLRTRNTNLVKVLFKNNNLDYRQVKIPQPGDLTYVFYFGVY